MELCERGDLAGRIKKCQRMRRRVDERTIWANMVEMAEGIAHLHSKNIYHRDMKPANVFLAADGTAKLGDLNVSKLTKGDDLMQTKIGTPYYMAPEVWDGRKYDGACDVWSIGTVVYELAALEPPFQASRSCSSSAPSRRPLLAHPVVLQLGALAQISLMLITDPSRRLTAQEIVDHDMVKKRRASHLLSHPSAAPEEVDDTELLATIKPPKSRSELKGLASQLSQMSAQVATSRSEAKSDAGGPPPPRASDMRSKLGALSEEAPSKAADNAANQLPGNRYGYGGHGGGGGGATSGAAPTPCPRASRSPRVRSPAGAATARTTGGPRSRERPPPPPPPPPPAAAAAAAAAAPSRQQPVVRGTSRTRTSRRCLRAGRGSQPVAPGELLIPEREHRGARGGAADAAGDPGRSTACGLEEGPQPVAPGRVRVHERAHWGAHRVAPDGEGRLEARTGRAQGGSGLPALAAAVPMSEGGNRERQRPTGSFGWLHSFLRRRRRCCRPLARSLEPSFSVPRRASSPSIFHHRQSGLLAAVLAC